MKEIERTFKLSEPIKEVLEKNTFLRVESVKIIEISYLMIEGNKEIKIMRIEDKNPDFGLEIKYSLIIKVGDGEKRTKVEKKLKVEEFYELKDVCFKKNLEKVLYVLYDENKFMEYAVSSYKGRHKGLDLIEVEFENEIEAYDYKPQEWMGEEVTNDLKYRCRSLC